MANETVSPNATKPITRVGLGGEGVLRTTGKAQAAQEVIKVALNHSPAKLEFLN
ncbi:hypothetical protein [Desulfobacula sp.]|uniref:hypothetical protein n=1 Tax=Desulfobacula sp. TaxID=2593537 RepID=UPI0026274DA4|nr:hypothetical protein [Desulfobacula sp.]